MAVFMVCELVEGGLAGVLRRNEFAPELRLEQDHAKP